MKVAKAKGRLRGKQPKLRPNQAELAELFGVGRSMVYRTIERMRPKPPERYGHSHISRILRAAPPPLAANAHAAPDRMQRASTPARHSKTCQLRNALRNGDPPLERLGSWHRVPDRTPHGTNTKIAALR
jgi:transcription elongation factor